MQAPAGGAPDARRRGPGRGTGAVLLCAGVGYGALTAVFGRSLAPGAIGWAVVLSGCLAAVVVGGLGVTLLRASGRGAA